MYVRDTFEFLKIYFGSAPNQNNFIPDRRHTEREGTIPFAGDHPASKEAPCLETPMRSSEVSRDLGLLTAVLLKIAMCRRNSWPCRARPANLLQDHRVFRGLPPTC